VLRKAEKITGTVSSGMKHVSIPKIHPIDPAATRDLMSLLNAPRRQPAAIPKLMKTTSLIV
jgi:hypothetical protein